jgi:hypothetical protein
MSAQSPDRSTAVQQHYLNYLHHQMPRLFLAAFLVVVLAVVMLLSLTSLTARTAHANSYQGLAGTAFNITSISTDKNIDINGESRTAGAGAIIWGHHYGANQRFSFTDHGDGTCSIIAIHSGLALDISGARIAAGAAVIQWPYHGGANQRWIMDTSTNTTTIVFRSVLDPNYVLDINGASSVNGAKLIIWPYHGRTNQQWTFSPVQPDMYVLVGDTYVITTVANSNRAVDISGASSANGAKALLYDKHGRTNQQFRLEFVRSTGYYKIINVNSGRLLDVNGASKASGAQVIQWGANGGLNQQWAIVPIGNGDYYIISALSGKALDVFGGDAANSGQIIQWPLHGRANQRWNFSLPDGTPAVPDTPSAPTAPTIPTTPPAFTWPADPSLDQIEEVVRFEYPEGAYVIFRTEPLWGSNRPPAREALIHLGTRHLTHEEWQKYRDDVVFMISCDKASWYGGWGDATECAGLYNPHFAEKYGVTVDYVLFDRVERVS